MSHVGGLDRSSSAWLAVRFGGSDRSWGLKKQSRVDPPRVSHAADAGATSGARATGPAETRGPVALIAPSMAGIKDEVESPLGLWDPLQTVEHRGLWSLWKEPTHAWWEMATQSLHNPRSGGWARTRALTQNFLPEFQPCRT